MGYTTNKNILFISKSISTANFDGEPSYICRTFIGENQNAELLS